MTSGFSLYVFRLFLWLPWLVTLCRMCVELRTNEPLRNYHFGISPENIFAQKEYGTSLLIGQVDARQIEGHWYWNAQKQTQIKFHSITHIRMGSASVFQVAPAADTSLIMTETSEHVCGSGLLNVKRPESHEISRCSQLSARIFVQNSHSPESTFIP
jgi:hypothetical protein